MAEILIVNNGGQYVHRIWRSLREIGVASEIIQPGEAMGRVESDKPIGVILSGGPTSVYEDSLGLGKEILEIGVPILGICWGHQFIAHNLGGKVKLGDKGEYGFCEIEVDKEDDLLRGVPSRFQAWVSHRDEVIELPDGFIPLAHSDICRYEAAMNEKKKIYSVQFHPEVSHTEHGEKILGNFVSVCRENSK